MFHQRLISQYPMLLLLGLMVVPRPMILRALIRPHVNLSATKDKNVAGVMKVCLCAIIRLPLILMQ